MEISIHIIFFIWFCHSKELEREDIRLRVPTVMVAEGT